MSDTPVLPAGADPRQVLAEIHAELLRRKDYVNHPVEWVQEQLGEVLWSKQRDILESVRDNRRTAVKSCHDVGKLLSLNTRIPTPTGWTTIGKVRPGDLVYGEGGEPVRVTWVSRKQTPERAYSVIFDDGQRVIAADTHQWQVSDFRSRARNVRDWRHEWDESTKTVTTQQMVDGGVLIRNGKVMSSRWRIPTMFPAVGEYMDWPLPPYAFGVWLGDGCATSGNKVWGHIDQIDQVADCLREDGMQVEVCNIFDEASPNKSVMKVRNMSRGLRLLGVLGRKHIPIRVLRAPIGERLAVLQGVMDTDGFIIKNGAGIDLASELLAYEVAELVMTFGWTVNVRKSDAWQYKGGVKYKKHVRYRMYFKPDLTVFRIPFKRTVGGIAEFRRSRTTCRSIVRIEPVESEPMKCLAVDSPRHLYMVEGFIPTHNSYVAARAAAWWLATHPLGDAYVITTAPTLRQVKAILWREIGRAHAKGKLFGRLNQTEWWAFMPEGNEEMIAFGSKPADMDPDAFQGIHAPFVLVIFDEACGIPKPLWEAADSLIANEESRILVIGNPDDPLSEFCEVCKPGSGWNVIRINAFESPNFWMYNSDGTLIGVNSEPSSSEGDEVNHHPEPDLEDTNNSNGNNNLPLKGNNTDTNNLPTPPTLPLPDKSKTRARPRSRARAESIPTGPLEVLPDKVRRSLVSPIWAEEKRKKWGETSPLFISKVTGEFPSHTTDGLIPLHWITRAVNKEASKEGVRRLGVDMGAGGDASTYALREGYHVSIIDEDHNPDTMQTCGKIIFLIRENHCEAAYVDYIGIGRGAVDRAKEQKAAVVGVTVSEAAQDAEGFANLRAEGYWHVRDLFQQDLMSLDPRDEDLHAQLADLKYKRGSQGGKIIMESKEEMKRRGKPSPNRADAFMLSLIEMPVVVNKKKSATWGR